MHEAEQLTAVVQETTFRNEDNGYTVLRVGTGRAQQTVVGVMPELSPGENVTFEGYVRAFNDVGTSRLRASIQRQSLRHHPAHGQERH